MPGFGVGREIEANASVVGKGLWSWIKGMPLLGVGKEAEGNIAQGVKDLSAIGKKDFREAQDVLSQQIGSGRSLAEGYAGAFNKANNLKEGNMITGKKIEGEFAEAYNAGDTSGIQSKYNIKEEHIGLMNSIMEGSKSQAGVLAKAGTAPYRMAKSYFLDGSPLSTLAKGATAVTAAGFLTGSRTSLTQANGERDIAGIPFV